MKTVAIIAARMGSTRLPGKVLRQLGRGKVLDWVVNAAHWAGIFDEVIVATTTETIDDAIVEYFAGCGTEVFRGSEQDVLERFYQAAQHYEADVIVRLTGDCPFLDASVISDVVLLRERENADYASNVDPPTWPDGLDVECFTKEALGVAYSATKRQSDRDCLTQFIQRNRHIFRVSNLTCPIPGLDKERWVLDTEDDLLFCEEVSKHLKDIARPVSYREILDVLKRNPDLRHINKHWTRNERFFAQRGSEPLPQRHYDASHQLYKRARKVQPYGASTYSKSVVAYGQTAPLYLTHGDGGVCYDVDGNDYVDFVGGCGAVILGHRNNGVDSAVRHQLDRGMGFSLGTELEIAICERLSLLPSGDNMVVLGKNGSDVTTAACRIARAFTKRHEIIVFEDAYHGWHDWAVAQTIRDYGIPPDDHHNKRLLVNLKDHELADIGNRDTAAVIVEPDRYTKEELIALRYTCTATGTLLIFDEVFTGLRYPDLLASREHHIHPDLTCVGKSIANGMPLSALIGRREIMRRFAPSDLPNAFYSTTHGGEALSLAACLATLDQMEGSGKNELRRTTLCVEQIVGTAIVKHGLQGEVMSWGVPLNRLTFRTPEIANQFRCEMAQNGVLVYSSFNCMVAHNSADLSRLESALDVTLGKINAGTARSYNPQASGIMRR